MQSVLLSPARILESIFGKCDNLTDAKSHSVRTPAGYLNTDVWMENVNLVVEEFVLVRYNRRRIIVRLRRDPCHVRPFPKH